MKTPSIFLNFNGNCREAFEFYQSVFGGEFGYTATYGAEGGNPMEVAENELDMLMYIDLPVAGFTLCGCDYVPSQGKKVEKGNYAEIVLNAEDKAEADDLFAKLSAGGVVNMPMTQEFFGYFGAFEDKFGIKWMVIAE